MRYLETIVNQPSPPYEFIANLDKVTISLVEMVATKAPKYVWFVAFLTSSRFGKFQAFRISWANQVYDSTVSIFCQSELKGGRKDIHTQQTQITTLWFTRSLESLYVLVARSNDSCYQIKLHGEVKIEFFQGHSYPPKEQLFYIWYRF